MNRESIRNGLIALALGTAALLAGCGGGDALPPGATPLTPPPDTLEPTVEIRSSAAGSTATGDVTFTFVFSENVGTSFSAGDVVVTGGAKGAFSMVSGTMATLVVTPPADRRGTLQVSVAAGRYADLAGNKNTEDTAASQAYNTIAAAIGSGSTGSCTAAPCIDFGSAGLAMVAFGGVVAEVAGDPGDAANKVVKLVKGPAAEVWGGATIDPGGTGAAKVAPFGFATSKTVTLRFLSPAVGETIMLKVENAADPAVFIEAQAVTKQAGQWETLTFDFGAPTNGAYDAGKTYDRVSIFPHFGTKTASDTTYYADELKYTPVASGAGCGTTAPTCAPTTTVPAGALAIYTEAAKVANFVPNPDWGQSPAVTYSEVTIASNKSLKYGFTAPALYEGLDWSANPVDVSTKAKLHIDFWSADVTSVKVSIISTGKENAVTKTLTAGEWNMIDIDLAEYTVPDKKAIIQIKLEPSTGGTLYVDNIYFWGTAPVVSVCGTTAPTCAPTTTVPAGALAIYTEAAKVANFVPNPDWGQSPAVTYSEVTIASNKSLKYGFTAPALYEGLDWSANPVNVSGKAKLHLDFWSADIASVKVSIISAGKENAVTKAVTAGNWNAVDIDLAEYTVPDKTAIIQIKLEPNVAGTLYVDNIYFWGTAPVVSVCGTTAPTCAPTTTVPDGALAIYTEAAKVANFVPNPDWGQSPAVTYSEVTIASNKSLKYGFTAPALYEGLDWAANPVDVSAKAKLHLDFWSADVTSVKVSIISAGKENAVTKAVTAGNWNAIDIDLAEYTVPDKTAIIQIKLEPNVAGTLYVDNIYFWGTATVSGCGTTAPTCAPTTTVPAGATVIYTDAASVAGFVPNPDWGQSPAVTYSEVTIAGNKSLKYGFTAPALYEGLDWAANPVDVSAKAKLHLDFWSADIASVKVSIISAGKENAVTKAVTAGSWNAIDIDLAEYTVPDKSAIIQIKLEPATGGTLYVDNIYFWGSGGGGSSSPVTFSSGFAGGNLTAQGGAFGGYSGSSLDGFGCSGDPAWCGSGGSFTPAVTAADSSFYYYYQTPSPVTALYAGIYVQAPGLTTGFSPTGDTAGISIAGRTTMKFTFGQNPEWFSSPTNNFGVILTFGKFYDVDAGAAVQPCNIKLLAVVTPSAAAPTAYSVPIADFGIIQSCNVAGLTPASVLALSPLSQVDFQAVGSDNPLPAVGGKLVGANMSVGVGSPAVYPTTLVVNGGIVFE